MELTTAIEDYATVRNLRTSTLAGYRLAIRSFSTWLGRPASAEDLTHDQLNRWARSMRDRDELSPYSIATYRRGILVLQRHLARLGIAERPDAVRLSPLRCPPTPRVVWTPDEVARLIAAVEELPNVLVGETGIRWRIWWRSALLAAWDSALRWSDQGRLTLRDIAPTGLVRIVQRKTGVEHVVRFSAPTLDAIAIAHPGRAPATRVWPTPSPTWRHKQFRRLLRQAGLIGTLQQIRRSAITAAELDRPGSGHVLAGHTTPATTFRWYIPRTSILTNPPAPPAIGAEPMDRRPAPLPEGRSIVHRLKIGESFSLVAPEGPIAEIDVRRDERRATTELVITRPQSEVPLRIVRRT